jgi:hypothetical protein
VAEREEGNTTEEETTAIAAMVVVDEEEEVLDLDGTIVEEEDQMTWGDVMIEEMTDEESGMAEAATEEETAEARHPAEEYVGARRWPVKSGASITIRRFSKQTMRIVSLSQLVILWWRHGLFQVVWTPG